MLITLIVFLLGVFLGGFAAAFFDFGIKIQFVTGKSAVPDWDNCNCCFDEAGNHSPNCKSGIDAWRYPRKPEHPFDHVQVDPRINHTR